MTKPSVLLVSVNECASPYPVYPLGIAHISSALQRAGYQPFIADLNIDHHRLEQIICETAPRYVGLSLRNIDDIRIDHPACFSQSLVDVIARVRAVSSAPVILGGSGYSLFPERLLELCNADFGIFGEGEDALVSLLDALESGSPHQDIPGLVLRIGGTVRCNQRTCTDAARIPPAARPRQLVSWYQDRSSMVNIQTQRGCCFTCCYCTYPLIEGSVMRHRPASEVADEFNEAIASGAGYLFIVDSVFNTSIDHVYGICEELLRRDIRIEWGCFLRPSHLTQECVNLMARAGLKHVEFGTDALSDRVLQAYGKHFSFDDILASSQMLRRAKVHYAHFLIVGGPGETEETLREGFANAQRIRRTVFFPFVGMRIYPGTPLYEQALAEGAVTRDDDMLIPRFYVSSAISKESINRLMHEFHTAMPNWVIDDSTAEQVSVMNGLRAKGVRGPLWEFLAQ